MGRRGTLTKPHDAVRQADQTLTPQGHLAISQDCGWRLAAGGCSSIAEVLDDLVE